MRLEGRPLIDVDLNLTNQSQSPFTFQMAQFFVGPQGPPGETDLNALQELGALQEGDLLLVERDGDQYSIEPEDMKEFLGLPVKISDPFNNQHEL